MKNRDFFHKDPLSWHLANEGVSSNNDADLTTLRYELETFVCDGEYKTGLVKMLQAYLDKFGKEQAGAWISGFYGSGKSHLVKVLRYLWVDHPFADGTTARSLATLPPDVLELLKELSTLGKRGGGLHSAGGTLKAGRGDVRLRVLGIIFLSVGLPEDVSGARLILDLRDDGTLEALRTHITNAGGNPDNEFGRFYTSKTLHEAYLATHPHLGDTKSVAAAIIAQYPPKIAQVSVGEMIMLIRRALTTGKALPCTVIVLDEVQQFINNDPNLSNDVQEVAEAFQKELDGRVLLIGTGQSALTDAPALQKLMGRFPIKTHLKDNDVEKVVRTVVLRKNPARKSDIEQLVSKHSGEISRQLKTTKIATRTDDQDAYVQDYPLLPVRRRFWEHVLHSVDPTGTTAQMRTQLRVTHEACRAVADAPVGTVIPGDFVYEQLATDLVISGEMQKRFQEIIETQKTLESGPLRARICSLVFLINKLPRSGMDIGVRADAEHIADLLTDDLDKSGAVIRSRVPELLTKLSEEGVLMQVDGEYRLQTTEGAAWEGEFRSRQTSIRNNDPQIAAKRGQLLSQAIQKEIASISILQGAAREKRTLTIHHGAENPPASSGLVVWIRDGFSEAEGSIILDIQKRSTDDPTVHVLVPKSKTDELKSSISAAMAAEETIHFKGNPTSPEGIEARGAMETRKATETSKTDLQIADVLSGARVFLSGGQELPVVTLKEAVESACTSALGSLYPKFPQADSANWATVYKKAREGNAGSLTAVGYSGDPDKHPVAAEIIRHIGAGKKGSDIYGTYTAAPYGWPKECLDACLATLLESGHLAARLNGQPAKLSELDQRKIGQADYRVQNPVLTAVQKLRIRKLYQEAGHAFQPGDEAAAAPAFVNALKNLAASAGGEAPAPETPRPAVLADLSGLNGNDLLHRLFSEADALTGHIAEWKRLGSAIALRMPDFHCAENLLRHAEEAGLALASSQRDALEAIRSHRSLLDDPEPVIPIRQAIGAALRTALHEAHATHEKTLAKEITNLDVHGNWSALLPEQKTTLLNEAGATSRSTPPIGSDSDLLAALQACSPASWQTHTDAIHTRCQQALAAAIKAAEPKARRVSLPNATIKTEAELEAWLAKAKATIQSAIQDGPAIV
jgi:hypothetical protein